MDSDDDFGSVVSSDDIDVDGDSSVDFGAAGEYLECKDEAKACD